MEPSLIGALQWEQHWLRTRAPATIFHGNVGRGLNEALNLQSGIVNVSLGKTRGIPTSNERYPSTANEPRNLGASADSFTWEAHEPGMALGKLILLRVRNHCFPEHLSSTHSTLQAVSNRNYKWQNKIKIPRHLCPHLFSVFSVLSKQLLCWAPSPQPGWTIPFAEQLWIRGARGLPHQCLVFRAFAIFWGVEWRAAGICIAQGPACSYGAASKHWPQGKGTGRGSQAP